MTAPDFSRFCGVKIKVLPDFLMDHTLLQQEFHERLPEHHSRWIQFVQRLWPWRGAATFCLRFDGRPAEGAVGLYFLAKPHSPDARAALQRDIEFALGAYGVVTDPEDHQRCLRLLTPAEVQAMQQTPEELAALQKEIDDEFSRVLAPQLADAVFVAVTQDVSRSLWTDTNLSKAIAGDKRIQDVQPRGMVKDQFPLFIPLSWNGPVGPYLLPFKALMSSPSPIQLSIYLEPCEVADHERLWLEKIASSARGAGQATDPAAELASLRCGSMARRLLGEAFLVSVQCAALDGDADAARSVANTMQALCREVAAVADGRAEDPIPGTRLHTALGQAAEAARQSHVTLDFPHWTDDSQLPGFLKRLQYLNDGLGVATVFRLPVSIRGGVPGVEVEQPPPDFNPGPRSDQRPIRRPIRSYRVSTPKPRVRVGKFENAGFAEVDLDDFTKHTLITGFTGSGKTKTVLHLLNQFWADHRVPFLVIESAKSEYRGLLGVPAFQNRITADGKRFAQLLIHTPGNERLAPMRLNPFELLPGVRVEAHVNRLQTCFEAALPPFGPLASILEQSLIEVYRDLGWMTTDEGVPRSQLGKRKYPQMTGFAAKLMQTGESRGYQGDNRATLLAAIEGRIRPLTRVMHSSKGRMLDVQQTWPSPENLFGLPVILELNDLNEVDKALISMFLLTLLREFREVQHKQGAAKGGKLQHVTVIEEAHNVLENVKSTGGQEGAGSDARFKAVQSFCAMLAEIRALGEGLVIADQSPEKLAPDAMRNTNIQIAHQLRASQDRNAVATAMIMTDEQRDYLGKLKPGYAGIFFTGLQKASFVKIPQFDNAEDEYGGRGAGFIPIMSDLEVDHHMRGLVAGIREPDRPFDLCRSCGRFQTCDYRWPVRELVQDAGAGKQFLAPFAKDAHKTFPERFGALAPLFRDTLSALKPAHPKDAAWCFYLHMRQKHLTNSVPGGAFDQQSRGFFEQGLLPALAEGEKGKP